MVKVKSMQGLIVVGTVLLLVAQTNAQVTSNILKRVYCIRTDEGMGSSFTIDVDERQYLITARHLVSGIKDGDTVEILHNDEWKKIAVRALLVEPPQVDIAVLAPSTQLSTPLPLEPSHEGLVLSQDMYFIGFPFGLTMEDQGLNDGFPIPLVKSGICSAWLNRSGYELYIIDGLNNIGFSGGPIVFTDQWTRALKVAGVVGGYHYQLDTVFVKEQSRNRRAGDKDSLVPTEMVVRSNTGLVIGYDIECAVKAIRKNPIGPLIKK